MAHLTRYSHDEVHAREVGADVVGGHDHLAVALDVGQPPAEKSASRRGSQLVRMATLDFQPPAPRHDARRVRMLSVLAAGGGQSCTSMPTTGPSAPAWMKRAALCSVRILLVPKGAGREAARLEVVVHRVPVGDAAAAG